MKQMEWNETDGMEWNRWNGRNFKFKLIKSYSEKKNRTFHNNIFKCIIENYQKEKSQGHKGILFTYLITTILSIY